MTLGLWRGPRCSMGCTESPSPTVWQYTSCVCDCIWEYTYDLWLNLHLSIYSMNVCVFELTCHYILVYTIWLCILCDLEFKCFLHDYVLGVYDMVFAMIYIQVYTLWLTYIHTYALWLPTLVHILHVLPNLWCFVSWLASYLFTSWMMYIYTFLSVCLCLCNSCLVCNCLYLLSVSACVIILCFMYTQMNASYCVFSIYWMHDMLIFCA